MNNDSVINNRKIKWLLVFVWMGVIFFLSHQPGDTSGALSGGFLEKIILIVGTIERFLSITIDSEVLHFLLRKGAHFTAYLILGFLLINALEEKGNERIKMYSQALGISLIYAISDEFHQTFIPGRAGQIQDVLIDFAGAATALIIWHIYKKRLSRNN